MSKPQTIAGVLIALTLFAAPSVSPAIVVATDPVVIEEFNNPYQIEYTVINPEISNVYDIVGFVIELDAFTPFFCDTANQWNFQAINDATDWDASMEHEGYPPATFPLTWKQFFGGIDYPFEVDQPAAAYFVAYSETGSYTFDDPSLAISPGESLDQFIANAQPMSTFVLAHIGDANNSFNADELPTFEGEAIPEPASASLLLLGAVAMLRRRKK